MWRKHYLKVKKNHFALQNFLLPDLGRFHPVSLVYWIEVDDVGSDADGDDGDDHDDAVVG
jgi:hypothetical protein